MASDVTRLVGFNRYEELRTLWELEEAYASEDCCRYDLRQIGMNIEGFKGYIGRPITEDGYEWFYGLQFLVNNGRELVILFPHVKRTVNRAPEIDERTGKFKFDRPLGVYVSGGLPIGISVKMGKHSFELQIRRKPNPEQVGNILEKIKLAYLE